MTELNYVRDLGERERRRTRAGVPAAPQPRRKRKKYGHTRRIIDVFLEMGIHSVFFNAPDVFGRDKATLYNTMRMAIDRNYQDAPVQVMMRSGEAGVWLVRTDADPNKY